MSASDEKITDGQVDEFTRWVNANHSFPCRFIRVHPWVNISLLQANCGVWDHHIITPRPAFNQQAPIAA